MIRRSQIVRLQDILENVDVVADMIAGQTIDAYRRDVMLRRAVERCVEIISEATRHIPANMKDEHPQQPWREIAGIGNLLRHHYERIDDLIMWKIATRSLPKLRPSIVKMLADEA